MEGPGRFGSVYFGASFGSTGSVFIKTAKIKFWDVFSTLSTSIFDNIKFKGAQARIERFTFYV